MSRQPRSLQHLASLCFLTLSILSFTCASLSLGTARGQAPDPPPAQPVQLYYYCGGSSQLWTCSGNCTQATVTTFGCDDGPENNCTGHTDTLSCGPKVDPNGSDPCIEDYETCV